jgi:lipid-A-disaccharide synthase-like uncharacterized protein
MAFELFGITITGWKIVGYLGVLLFASRWFIQLYASKKRGRPVITNWFWIVSLLGSFMLLTYFVFGKNDSVGILSNMFPAFIAVYNLYLDAKYRRKLKRGVKAKYNFAK